MMTATLPVYAQGKAELEGRILSLTSKFETLQQQPDKRIPADVLRRAHGLILLDRTKAGFLFAYQGGSGVALAKDRKGLWSAPAFVKANEASLGFQIGAEQNFFVILLMTDSAPRFLTEPNFEFGGEARGTAGNTTAGTQGTISDTERPVLVYSSREGLYAGAAVKGGAVSPDEDANQRYYGEFATMRDILYDHKFEPTPAANYLVSKLNAYASASNALSKQ